MTAFTLTPEAQTSLRAYIDARKETDTAARDARRTRPMQERVMEAVKSAGLPEFVLAGRDTRKLPAKRGIQERGRHDAKTEHRRAKEKNRRRECRKGWKR